MSRPKTRIVFVGHLPTKCTEQEIREVFEKIGEVEHVGLMLNEKGESKRAALVTFKSPDMAEKAVDELHETKKLGVIINVELRKTKLTERSEFEPKSSKIDENSIRNAKYEAFVEKEHEEQKRKHRKDEESSSSESSDDEEPDKKRESKKKHHHRHHKHRHH